MSHLDVRKPPQQLGRGSPHRSRAVRVRINACGEWISGWVPLPPSETARCSGRLNEEDPFLLVVLPGDESGPTSVAINKDTISYVVPVDEPALGQADWIVPGRFHPVVITLWSPAVVLRGELFSVADGGVADVLNDSRPFLSLRNARVADRDQVYSYLGVSKAQIREVRF